MSFTSRARAIVAAVQASGFGRLVRRYAEDRADLLVAAVAFSVLFSMFPIILGVLALVGAILRSPGARTQAETFVLTTIPAGASAGVLQAIDGVRQSASLLGLLSLVGVVWGGVSLFWALEAVFDQIYRVRPRSLLRQTLMALAMMLLFALLVVAMLLAATVAQVVGQLGQSLPVVSPETAPTVTAAGIAISFLAAFALCFAIYFVVPNVRITASQVLPGTLFASLALVLLTQMFPLYVLYLGRVNPYGAVIGLFFLLMTWAYLVALALVIGAEINSMSRLRTQRRRHEPVTIDLSRRPGEPLWLPDHVRGRRR